MKQLSTGVGVLVICGLATGFHPSLAQCRPDQVLRTPSPAYGGGGGAGFDDRNLVPNLYKEPITKIEIWSGNFVDAIRITYGKNSPSPIHGGDNREPGGIHHSIDFAPNEYVTQISGQAGNYIDKICFITNLKTEAQCFGGSGGNTFQVANPEGYPLRAVLGHSGRFLDQAQFVFGNFSQIDVNSFKYDQNALDQALVGAPVKTFDQYYSNKGTSTFNATFQASRQLTHTESLQLTKTQLSSRTQAVEANVGFKTGEAKTGGEISLGAKYSYSWTVSVTNQSQSVTSDSEQTNSGWSLQYAVPPHTDTKITTQWKQLNLAIPVNYDVQYYTGNNQEICRDKIQGTLTGSGASTLTQLFYTSPNQESKYKLRKTVVNRKPNAR